MFQQRVKVHYADGTSAQVTLTQWSIGQFAQYASRQGLNADPKDPGFLAVVMLRYQAYCELHRDPSKPRAAFDKWDMTVNEVEPEEEEAAAADPTEPEPSAA